MLGPGAPQVAPANAGDVRDMASNLAREDPPEESMATHCSILSWRTPWTEEPGGLQSMGLQSQTRLAYVSLWL